MQGVLIAQTETTRQQLPFHSIAQIACENVIGMLVVRAVGFVVDVVGRTHCLTGVAVVVAVVVAHDVLQACLQGVYLGKGRGIVYLEGLLQRIAVLFVTLVFKHVQIVLPCSHAVYVMIRVFVFVIAGVAVDLVRQGEQAVFHREGTLIVDASVYGRPSVAGTVEVRIMVKGTFVEGRCCHYLSLIGCVASASP